jgi:hypothetical protein
MLVGAGGRGAAPLARVGVGGRPADAADLRVYGFTASNSTRMLWWTRRYVPTVLPGIVVLLALAIAFFVVWRFRGRLLTAVPAVAALAGWSPSSFAVPPAPGARRVEGSFALTQEDRRPLGGPGRRLPVGVRPGLLRRG